MLSRRLGPIEVSAISHGCFSYAPAEERATLALLDRALELGVVMLDTSDTYGIGESERLVGRAVRGRRDRVVLATKFGQIRLPGDSKPRGVCGRPDYAREACDASLARLGVEHIDLYYLHRVDPHVPVEETVGAMADLVRAGKVRYLGLSEVDEVQLRRALAVHPVAAVQNEYSLISRETEALIPVLEGLGIGMVAYSPLGRGLLTGDVQLGDADARRQFPRFSGENLNRNLALVETLRRLAAQRGATPGQLALAWVLSRGNNVIAIPGTRRIERLEENIRAAQMELSADEVRALELAFSPGVASGARR